MHWLQSYYDWVEGFVFSTNQTLQAMGQGFFFSVPFLVLMLILTPIWIWWDLRRIK
jgi:predicted ABC-type sugar transport system permease subunit